MRVVFIIHVIFGLINIGLTYISEITFIIKLERQGYKVWTVIIIFILIEALLSGKNIVVLMSGKNMFKVILEPVNQVVSCGLLTI